MERLEDPEDPFSIVPLPAVASVGVATVDLKIGNIFLLTRRAVSPSLKARDLASGANLFDETRIVSSGSVSQPPSFVMQPGQFVLAGTLEYLSMPPDLGGNIQSRSTYGRMGIIAATAAYIGPNYKGSPTLELVNAGEMPIEIEPYASICQLVIIPVIGGGSSPSPSRYQLATRPSAYLPTIADRLRDQPDDHTALNQLPR